MAKKKIDRDFTLSDSTVNVYGFRLLTSGYQPEPFQANPIGYYMHKRDEEVLLRWDDIRIEGDKILAKPVINLSHPRGERTVNEVMSGFLNAASMGKIVVLAVSEDPADYLPGQEGPTISKWYNREASLVDLGGNENATAILLVDAAGNEINLSDIKIPQMKQWTLTAAQLAALNLADTADAAAVASAIKDLADTAAKVPALEAAVGAEKARADKAVQDLADATKAAAAAQVNAILDKGLADKKLTKALSEKLAAQFADKPTELADLVAAMPAYQSVTGAIAAATGAAADLSDKSWDDLDKSGKLADLKAKDPEAYKAKFKEKFGKEPMA